MIGWAIEALIASTVLMLAVLVLRGPVRRGFGPGLAYALWALPLLRLLLPPLPANWRDATAAPIAQASETITILVIQPLGLGAAAASSPQHPSLGLGLATLWGLGAAVFLGWHVIAHTRFCRRLLAGSRRDTTIADGKVEVIESAAAAGPLAFGIWRKYVAFPRDFSERYDEDERDLALAHELGHHARGDLIANWAALVVLALHWFNPIAWRSFRAFRADQEMANDARVLAGRSPAFRHAYGRAIVKSAHGGTISAACHLHTINELKGRLKMLSITRKSRARLISGAAAVGLLTLTGLGVTASGTQAAETIRAKVGDTIGVDFSAPTAFTPFAKPEASAPFAKPAAFAPFANQAPVGIIQVEPTPVPDMPPAAAAPPAPASYTWTRDGAVPVPPAPPTPPSYSWTRDDGTPAPDGRREVKRVKVIRDGKVIQDDIVGDMPEVSSENCRPAGDKDEMVIHDNSGGRNRIIICTDRIERVAAKGAEMAARSGEIERNAYRSALAGLRSAREKMLADRRIAGDDRKEALEAIDQSIAEIEGDLAQAGNE